MIEIVLSLKKHQRMKTLANDSNQSQTHKFLAGDLKSFKNSDWWKLIVKRLESISSEIKSHLRDPKVDQSLKFNADQILKERLTVIYMFMNLPDILIDELDQLSNTEENQNKSLYDRLKDMDSRMAEDILSKIKT